jgi:pimeloyl-ACP methyl ester carboxylesterase
MFLKILIIIILLIIVILNVLAWIFMWQTFRSSKIDDNTAIRHFSDYQDDYECLPVECNCRGNRLKGNIYKKKDLKEKSETFLGDTSRYKGLILFVHGIWSGPDEYMQTILPLVDRGYAVIAFNATSYNGSQGKWARGLATSMLNADAELNFIESDDDLKSMKVFLLGHSWGAYAVTAVLRFKHNVQAVVSLSGFNKPMDISKAVGKNVIGFLSGPVCACISIYQRIFFGKYYNCAAVDGINQPVYEKETDSQLNGGSDHRYVPVLIVHGINDPFITFEGTSIYSKKDQIKNPNVSYLKLEEPGRSEHNSYFNSKAGAKYIDEINKHFEELKKSYKGDALIAEKRKFLSTVDKELSNEPNEWLIEKIDDFFTQNIYRN